MQQAQTRKKITSESKLLDVTWDNLEDTIAVQFRSGVSAPTKRGASKGLRPSRTGVPHYTAGKTNLPRSLRLQGIMGRRSSTEPLPGIRWQQWEQLLPAEVTTPRPFVPHPNQSYRLNYMYSEMHQPVGSERQFIQLFGKKREPIKPWLQLKQD